MTKASDTGRVRVGILGGTFDPIHYGHLVAAETARSTLDLDQVLFVPCGQPPHKNPGETTAPEQRYLMTVLATTGWSGFHVSRLELERPGPSYTVDTLRQLRSEYAPGAEYYFIVGTDTFLGMTEWKDPDQVMSLARIVIMHRAGYEHRRLDARLAELPPEQSRLIQQVEMPPLDISASELRRRVQRGQSIRHYVPAAVAAYLEQYSLYVSHRQ